jgi:hypothetical protein
MYKALLQINYKEINSPPLKKWVNDLEQAYEKDIINEWPVNE